MLTIAKQAATIVLTNQYDTDHTSPLSIDHHSVVTSRLIANTDHSFIYMRHKQVCSYLRRRNSAIYEKYKHSDFGGGLVVSIAKYFYALAFSP